MKTTAWLLAGAGAKGIVQAGMIFGLLEAGFTYDILFGASAGALNGALLHQGDLIAMRDLWMNIRSKDVRTFAPWKAFTSEASIYDNAPLAKLMDRYIDPDKLKKNSKPFAFSVTDLTQWQSIVYTASQVPDDQIKKLLTISASPPLLTPLHKIGVHSDMVTDGGMTNDFGITWARDAEVMVVFMPTVPRPPKIKSIIDVIDSVLEVALYCYLQREIEASNKNIVVIQPERPLDIGVLDFDYKQNRQDLMNYGRTLANKALPQIRAFST